MPTSPIPEADGHWPRLLSELGGLDPAQLTDEHQPCPACGGTDRYRWDNDEGPGAWFCNQCGGKQRHGGGGTGADLLMRLRGWTFAETAQKVRAHLGTQPQARPAPRQRRPKRAARIPDVPPADTPPPALDGAVEQYPYGPDAATPWFWIQRVAQPPKPGSSKPGKLFVHRTWLDGRWHRPSKSDPFTSEWPAPRPVFRLPELLARPDAPVLVVEGEAVALAAAQLFPDHAVISGCGGTGGLNATDWSPLAGRTVALWPDADPQGVAHMAALAQRLLAAGSSVRAVQPPADAPRGWDLADALALGWTPRQAAQQLQERARVVELAPQAEPEPEPDQPAGPRTAAQALGELKALAAQLLADRCPFGDRVPLLRARASELDLNLRDGELSRLIWDARRAASGAHEPLRPGDRIDLSPTRWAWDSILLPGALNLLVALPKIGKTSLALAMVSAWHRGAGQFLGQELMGHCPPVLIVGTDQPQSDWGRMMLEAGLIGDDGLIRSPIVALYHAGRPLHLTQEGIEIIANHAKEHPGLFVLIDSVSACLTPLGIDENSSEVGEPVRDLVEALEPHGATILLIHHASKGRAGESPTLASRGSGALPAAASQIIALAKVATPNPLAPEDPRIVLRTDGRAGAPQKLLIERSKDSGEWLTHGSAEQVAKAQAMAEQEGELNERQADVLEFIRVRWADGAGRTSSRDIAEALQLGKDGDRLARRSLDQLVRRGLALSVLEVADGARTKRWWPTELNSGHLGTPSRGGLSALSYVSDLSSVPPSRAYESLSADTPDTKDTQDSPPREGVLTHADPFAPDAAVWVWRPAQAAWIPAVMLGADDAAGLLLVREHGASGGSYTHARWLAPRTTDTPPQAPP